jgi:hypothetical protein
MAKSTKTPAELLSILKKKLKKEKITIFKETSKSQKLRIESSDRVAVKEKIPSILKGFKIKESHEGSVGSYDIIFDKYYVRLLFKNKSGGMSETTLNSTITELVPCILFMDKKTSLMKNFDKAWDYLLKNPNKKVYVGNDAKVGNEYIRKFKDSSKFEEKMTNAKGIIDYFKNLDKEKSIKNLYWGYRAKPAGIDSKHKGDVFVEFSDGKMLGVSLKAGTGKSEEPKLNTYVNAVLENLNETSLINKLQKDIYKQVHSKIGLPKSWTVRQHIDEIIKYRKSVSQDVLDKNYNDMLELCRAAVVKAFNSNKKNTIKFISQQILAEDENVPLVVVKGLNSGRYEILTEEDELAIYLPKIKSVKSYPNKSSKQNWHIGLKSSKNTLTLNMSIRTNKSKPFNKLAQGYNLAIKFNSLTLT